MMVNCFIPLTKKSGCISLLNYAFIRCTRTYEYAYSYLRTYIVGFKFIKSLFIAYAKLFGLPPSYICCNN